MSDDHNLLADGRTILEAVNDAARDYQQQQIDRAETGTADNQCPACGAYRTDGKPPAVHLRACARDQENWLALHRRLTTGNAR
jgi:hypothetical protein